jgi:hypothetical protein
MCTNCRAEVQALWAIGPPYPQFTQVESGNFVVLNACTECGQLWLESMYEPFAAFRYSVKWPRSIEQFRLSRDGDQSNSLCKWHEAEVRVQGNRADKATLDHIHKHYARAGGFVDLSPSAEQNLVQL